MFTNKIKHNKQNIFNYTHEKDQEFISTEPKCIVKIFWSLNRNETQKPKLN